ncbi:hypothetical protein FQR65_LT01683 [Abscondita terminalis]|nr:hypothetical protein FQR65_LT01683 [Abscondita terminalis]
MKMFQLLILVILLQWGVYVSSAEDNYKIPQPQIFVSRNSLQITLPDENGIELFYFYGRITKKSGDVVKTVINTRTKLYGLWTLTDYNLVLDDGDVITYWLYVRKNGVSYRMPYGVYVVEGVMGYTTTSTENGVLPSNPGTEKPLQVLKDPVNIDSSQEDENEKYSFSCDGQLKNLTKEINTMELHMESLEVMVFLMLDKLNEAPNNRTK